MTEMDSDALRDSNGQYIRGQQRYTDEELIEELQLAMSKTDGNLTQREYNDISDIPHVTQCERFGSWNEAKKEAGQKTERYSADVPRRERRERIDDIKETQACESCGDNRSSVAMDFHHKEPEKKTESIAEMCNSPLKYSWGEVLDEISNCSLVCKSCHAEIEWGERPCP